MKLLPCGHLLGRRDLADPPFKASLTKRRERTLITRRRGRRTYGCAQLHHSFVQQRRVLAYIDEPLGPRPQSLDEQAIGRRRTVTVHPGKQSRDIAIYDGFSSSPDDRRDTSSRISTNTWQRKKFRSIDRHFAIKPIDNLTSCSMQTASTTVVPQPLPHSQYILLICNGEQARRRKTIHKWFKSFQDARHLRLLQHEFTDKSTPRRAWVSPWQIPGVVEKPTLDRHRQSLIGLAHAA